MAWQSSTINPAVTTPADDIAKIKNDLQVLRGVLGGTADADVPLTAVTGATVNSIAVLRTVVASSRPSVFVLGYYAPGDGGGGRYYYDAADTTSPDNGGTVIVGASGARWKLVVLGHVSVKQFGAKGDVVYDYLTQTLTSGSDDTAAIQAAIDWCVQSNIVSNGRTCTVWFPHAGYKITNELKIRGAVALLGDGSPMSISGSRIFQTTANKSLFNSTEATNSAIHMQGLLLRDMTGVVNTSTGLFKHSSDVTSGNSFYFRWNWFSTPSHYAINIDGGTDDLQITENTFDVTAQKWIKVGSSTGLVTNATITGNTFYAGTNHIGCIDLVRVRAIQISGNRVYGGGFRIPYFVNANSTTEIEMLQINSNTFDEVNMICYTNKDGLQMVGNTIGKGSILVQFQGGVMLRDAVVKANRFEGATSIIGAAYGIIDATGTPLYNCDLEGNSLVGNVGGTTAIAVNVPHTSSDNNKVRNSIRNGTVTTKYVLGSSVANGLSPYLATSWTWTPTIAAGAYVENSIAITGLSANDMVSVTPILPITLQAGIVVTCYATAGSLVIRYTNVTGSSITAVNQNFKVRAFRPDDF